MKSKHTVLFLSHGGGPMPLLGDKGHDDMLACLQGFATDIPKPSAILLVSAHWEADKPRITYNAAPELIYDYYGFPEEAYEVSYPAKGEPELAETLYGVLERQGIDAVLDKQRGFDHGLFVPLKIMYPEADIPCIQLSLVNHLAPQFHIDLGEALSLLEYDNLLIIGSGFSFHNLKAFFAPPTSESEAMNNAFEDWLIDTCSSTCIDEAERTQRLLSWEQAPFANYCHPREEHLIPLHVCYGAAKRPCSQVFEQYILNKKASAYLWQA